MVGTSGSHCWASVEVYHLDEDHALTGNAWFICSHQEMVDCPREAYVIAGDNRAESLWIPLVLLAETVCCVHLTAMVVGNGIDKVKGSTEPHPKS